MNQIGAGMHIHTCIHEQDTYMSVYTSVYVYLMANGWQISTSSGRMNVLANMGCCTYDTIHIFKREPLIITHWS